MILGNLDVSSPDQSFSDQILCCNRIKRDPRGGEERFEMAMSEQELAVVPGVGTVRPRTSQISQVVTLTAVVVPPLGLGAAMGIFWEARFRWPDLGLFLGMYVVCAFGITVGFHRYFTHRGFDACTAVKALLAVLGCMTMQGPLTQWVTDHRKHHALSDKPGDPHSPHGHGDGAWGALRGFVHAHVGWMFTSLGMEQGKAYGSDLYEDRLVRSIARL